MKPDRPDGTEARCYRSRIDWWLMGPIFAAPLIVAALSLASEPGHRWVPLCAAGLTTGLILLLLLPCHYTFVGDMLEVRSGVLRWRLALREIREIKLSDSWNAGPALSLRRIRIEMDDGNELLISPNDREEFLSQVQARQEAFHR